MAIGSKSDCWSRGRDFNPSSGPHTFVVYILWSFSSFLQVAELLVTSKSTDKLLSLSLQKKFVVKLTIHFDMTIAVVWDINP